MDLMATGSARTKARLGGKKVTSERTSELPRELNTGRLSLAGYQRRAAARARGVELRTTVTFSDEVLVAKVEPWEARKKRQDRVWMHDDPNARAISGAQPVSDLHSRQRDLRLTPRA
jgi:hypothetical protein